MHIISTLSLVFGNSHEFGKKRQLVSNSCFRIEKDSSIQYDEDDFNEKEDSISSDDDYEDDRPDFDSQTQLHVADAGAKVLNRKGNELQNLHDDYEDDRPDSQTQPHSTVAGANVLNRKVKELQNLDPENKKYHNFRYACEEKTCRCFTNKTKETKINITTRQHYYSLAMSNRL